MGKLDSFTKVFVCFFYSRTPPSVTANADTSPQQQTPSFNSTFGSQLDDDFISVVNKLEEDFNTDQKDVEEIDQKSKSKEKTRFISRDQKLASEIQAQAPGITIDPKPSTSTGNTITGTEASKSRNAPFIPENHDSCTNLENTANNPPNKAKLDDLNIQIVAKRKRNELLELSNLDLTLSSPLHISTPTNTFRTKASKKRKAKSENKSKSTETGGKSKPAGEKNGKSEDIMTPKDNRNIMSPNEPSPGKECIVNQSDVKQDQQEEQRNEPAERSGEY